MREEPGLENWIIMMGHKESLYLEVQADSEEEAEARAFEAVSDYAELKIERVDIPYGYRIAPEYRWPTVISTERIIEDGKDY